MSLDTINVEQKFATDLAAALKGIGLEATYDEVYLIVGEVKFPIQTRRTSFSPNYLTVISIADTDFRPKKDGSYDIEKAVTVILKVLPRRIEENKRRELYTSNLLLIRHEAAQRGWGMVSGMSSVATPKLGMTVCVEKDGKFFITKTAETFEEVLLTIEKFG